MYLFYLRVRQSQKHRCIHYCKKLWILIWLADIQGNLVTMCVELYHVQEVSISRSFTFNRMSTENNTTTLNNIGEIIRAYYWVVSVTWKQEVLILRDQLGTSSVGLDPCYSVLSILLCLSPYCVMCPTLPVFLNCPYLMVPLFISNVYTSVLVRYMHCLILSC